MATLAFGSSISTELGVDDKILKVEDFLSYFLTCFPIILHIWIGGEDYPTIQKASHMLGGQAFKFLLNSQLSQKNSIFLI